MNYLDALGLAHSVLRPANYCEIGCRNGYSLALSHCPSVGIDPDYEIKQPISAPVRLFKETSDAFFARPDVDAILGGPVDFAFIDGMHLVENALRDFINLERHSSSRSVIAIDDLLPGNIIYASRERQTQIWTGDVYRLILVLKAFRPDLDIKVYDVTMKGLGVVSNLDPGSTVLSDMLDGIEARLAAGNWLLDSVDAIRAALSPLPVDRLAGDFEALAARRMVPDQDDARRRYLELLKKSILNEIYLDDELRILYLKACVAGEETYERAVLHDIRNARREDYEALKEGRQGGLLLKRKLDNLGFAHTMIGRARMDNIVECLHLVRNENIAGDLVECGVLRGGACILMAGYLNIYGMNDRRVFVADSFDGLPPPTLPQEKGLNLAKTRFPQLAVSLETVRENFAAYDLDKPNVRYLKGWFKDTLPDAPMSRIALLRMDGDLYESTMDILTGLYDRVVDGGVIIVDDYGILEPCRRALADFFATRDAPLPEMTPIDTSGVWFRKPAETYPITVASTLDGRSFATAFPEAQLAGYQAGTMRYSYGGLPCIKSPIDLALYLTMLRAERPATIIEIGTKHGGGALMLRDFSALSGRQAQVVSIDVNRLDKDIPGIRFLQGDVLNLDEVFEREGLYRLPRPWFVVEDSAHTAAGCAAALAFFARCLRAGEWLVMEDGVLDDLGWSEKYGGGPNKAIADFMTNHPGVYEIGIEYCDMFGTNATYNPNGYLRKTAAPFAEKPT